MNLKLVQAGVGGSPVDLTTCTEIDIALPKEGGGFTHLKLSDDEVEIVGSPLLGKFSAAISSEVSATLKVGQLQNLDVTFTIGADALTIRFAAALSVYNRSSE